MPTKRFQQSILILCDAILLYISLAFALSIRAKKIVSIPTFLDHTSLFSIIFLGSIVLFYIFGRYDRETIERTQTNLSTSIGASFFFFLFASLFFYILPEPTISPKTILFLTVLFGGISTFFIRKILFYFLFQTQKKKQVGIIGDATQAEIIELTNHPDFSVEYTVLWIKKNPTNTDLASVEKIILHETEHMNATLLNQLYHSAVGKKMITQFSKEYERITHKIPVYTCTDKWFVTHVQTPSILYIHTRNLIDYSIGIILAIVTALLYPFIALAIKITSPGPIIFTQERIGKHGTPFTLLKFRTMYALAADGSAETNGAAFAQKKDTRITPVGSFLRKTRLDELPQCINILRRDISLVGPRPERPEIMKEILRSAPYFSTRTLIMPGITGWAAVTQHYTDSAASTIEKLQYDLYYIKYRSFLLDIKIILLTIRTIIRFKGQ